LDKGSEGEEAVLRIASQTYLKYWCYPEPKDEQGTGKEICDLLILFKNIAIIIEVKNYKFKGDYKRYFNKTLKKAISQISGAERKLFKSKEELVFKHYIKGDKVFKRNDYTEIQRLVVNLSTVPLFYPAGELTKSGSFVHIFNWFAFLKVVQELDTIPDFIQYLCKREETFKNKQLVIASGREESWTIDINEQFLNFSSKLNPAEKAFVVILGTELDLLADYLQHNREFSGHLTSDKYNGITVELDENWSDYISREQVQRKKVADKRSYFLDKFIRKEILYFDDDLRLEIATELLSLNRFQRRIVSQQFYSFMQKYHNQIKHDGIARRYGTIGNLTIGFFMHGQMFEIKMVMELMKIAAYGYSHFEKYESKKILIIGIDAEMMQTKFVYMDEVEEIKGEALDNLLIDLKELNWFNSVEWKEYYWKEYPE